MTKHSKDELVLQSVYSDLEDFYDTIVLPPPPRKPRGKATVENHVRYLETHLIELLKERTYTSLEDINRDIKEKVAVLNSRKFQNRPYSRLDAFERYDKPCMKPLPHEIFTVCDYKAISKVRSIVLFVTPTSTAISSAVFFGSLISIPNNFSFNNIPTSGIGHESNNEQERLQRLYNTISTNVVDPIK